MVIHCPQRAEKEHEKRTHRERRNAAKAQANKDRGLRIEDGGSKIATRVKVSSDIVP